MLVIIRCALPNKTPIYPPKSKEQEYKQPLNGHHLAPNKIANFKKRHKIYKWFCKKEDSYDLKHYIFLMLFIRLFFDYREYIFSQVTFLEVTSLLYTVRLEQLKEANQAYNQWNLGEKLTVLKWFWHV